MRERGEIIGRMPFNSDIKYMSTIHTDGKTTLYVKGAPEFLLSKCAYLKVES